MSRALLLLEVGLEPTNPFQVTPFIAFNCGKHPLINRVIFSGQCSTS
jgi:hypothetical protein